PMIVEIDIRDIKAGSFVTLVVDLLGFGAADSEVAVDDIRLLANSIRPPVAVTDMIKVDEDKSVSFDVLANDVGRAAPIATDTLQIVSGPLHGSLVRAEATSRVGRSLRDRALHGTVVRDEVTSWFGQLLRNRSLKGSLVRDEATRLFLYEPFANFSGSDQFTYTVEDESGLLSNETTVLIDVVPVADMPQLSVEDARGPQDSLIPLDISAQLTDLDGSEWLYVDVVGLPVGASLSAGTVVNFGHYRLLAAELPGLELLPPPGETGTYSLDVTAVATERANGDLAAISQPLNVIVDQVVVEPLMIVDFVVNDGAAQRSTIQKVAVTFNQDVRIGDYATDVTVTTVEGEPIPLDSARYSYDESTFTLTIDLGGISLADGHYAVNFNTLGIGSAAARNVQLAAGLAAAGQQTIGLEFHRLLADFTGDDTIDLADWEALQTRYHTEVGQPDYDAVFDMTGDGQIDRFDYAIWRTRQSLTSDIYAPILNATVMSREVAAASLTTVTDDEFALIGLGFDTSPIVR
ncbi:MAG: Ig-like domain-containing protein, partial [Pirellulales bacterium]